MNALPFIKLLLKHYCDFSNVLEIKIVFLDGLEAVESQVIVGLGECTLTLLTKQHTCSAHDK